MPCSRCEACFSKRDTSAAVPPRSQQQQQQQRAASVDTRLVHSSSASSPNRRVDQQQHSKPWRLGHNHYDHTSPSVGRARFDNSGTDENSGTINGVAFVRVGGRAGSQPPPCRSPNKYYQHVADINRQVALQRQHEMETTAVEYNKHYPASLQNLQQHRASSRQPPAKFVDPLAPAPMPLFHNPISPRRKYDSSLTLGPVNVNSKTYLRRSMEKLPVQVPGPDGAFSDSTLWTNPELQPASTLLRASEEGIGNVRWWRKHISFSMPYDPAVQDYDPSWVNSAVQRVVSDRGVTVHKMSTYAPQHWDSSSAPHLGEAAATGVPRSWSLEERAARSVGSVRAANGIALRCNHFLGESASVHPKASLAGRCLTGETASTLLSLARPKTISRGSERGATGLSLAKFAYVHEQSSRDTYPGIYPNIGVR